jgi:hypothetical protein
MSHITRVKTKLRDGEILRKVLEKVGYNVQEGSTIYGASRRTRPQADEMTATKGTFKIGFRRSTDDGCYEIQADWETHRRPRKWIIDEIFQWYSYEKIIKEARRKGYAVIQNRTMQTGQIELVLRKVA